MELINSGKNASYLSGIGLSKRISATSDIAQTVRGPQMIVVAVPVAAVRFALESARGQLAEDAVFLSLAKSLELESLLRADEIIAQTSGANESRIAILSNPNLSREIAEYDPTAAVIASTNLELAGSLAKSRHTSCFRPYVSTDVIGSEIAGAAKNVIAVAIGTIEGMDSGVGTRATLIARGLTEITRLGTTLGADPQTFAGPTGVGDLMTVCSSRLSRNFSFDHRVGQGMGVEEAVALSPGVVEDARSVEPIFALAKSSNVDVLIISTVIAVVRDRASIEQIGQMLPSHPQKMDGWKVELI